MAISLDSEFPGLVHELEGATADEQRAAALAAAQMAIMRTQLRDHRLNTAAAANRFGDCAEREAVSALTDELDEVAWTIQARVHHGMAAEEEYSRAFRKARAASALFFALDENPLNAAIQGLYEAHHAIGDGEALREMLDQILANRQNG
jgi:hypothetical protein